MNWNSHGNGRVVQEERSLSRLLRAIGLLSPKVLDEWVVKVSKFPLPNDCYPKSVTKIAVQGLITLKYSLKKRMTAIEGLADIIHK